MTMWHSVMATESEWSNLNRDASPASVARLIAGINVCRVGTVVAATAASSAAPRGSVV
jgi:hypothetical protein